MAIKQFFMAVARKPAAFVSSVAATTGTFYDLIQTTDQNVVDDITVATENNVLTLSQDPVTKDVTTTTNGTSVASVTAVPVAVVKSVQLGTADAVTAVTTVPGTGADLTYLDYSNPAVPVWTADASDATLFLYETDCFEALKAADAFSPIATTVDIVPVYKNA